MKIFIAENNPVYNKIENKVFWKIDNQDGTLIESEQLLEIEGFDFYDFKESSDVGIYVCSVIDKSIPSIQENVYLNFNYNRENSVPVKHIYKYLTYEECEQYFVRIEEVIVENNVKHPRLFKKIYNFPKDCIYIVDTQIECDVNGKPINDSHALHSKLRKTELLNFKDSCKVVNHYRFICPSFYDDNFIKDNVIYIYRLFRSVHLSNQEVGNIINIDNFNKFLTGFDFNKYPEYLDNIKNINQILEKKRIEDEQRAIETIKKLEEDVINKITEKTKYHLEQTIITLKTERDNIIEKIESSWEKLNELIKSKEHYSFMINASESKLNELRIRAKNPIDELRTIENFSKILIINNVITVLLKDMYFTHNNVIYELPKSIGYEIHTSKIYIICKKSEAVLGYNKKLVPHPHAIYDIGSFTMFDDTYIRARPCWGDGEIYKNISEFISRNDFSSITRIVVNWLKHVNPSDSAGQYFTNFKIKEKIAETEQEVKPLEI